MTTDTTGAAPGKSGGNWIKLVIALAVLAGGIFLLWHFGLFEKIRDVEALRAFFDGFGIWGPIVFVLVWIAACIFFLPGLPVTIVGAVVFGPIWGSVYSIIGATIGATAAFLVGRYAARDMVAGMVAKNKVLSKIDEGVEKQGWRMLMITRLVPVFPFNAQNYVYGLTKIPLLTYAVLTGVFMLPGTIMFNFAAGKLAEGKFDAKTLWYLGIAAVLFVGLSLLPGFLKKRFGGADLVDEKSKN